MKKIIVLFLGLVLLPGITIPQSNRVGAVSLKTNAPDFSDTHLSNPRLFPDYQDSVYFSQVMHHINKASMKSGAGIVLGSISNITLFVNVGVLNGELYGWQGLVGVVGLTTGIIRWTISLATLKDIQSAEIMLLRAENSIWTEDQIENSLRHMRTAENATKAVSIFGIAGLGLVAGGVYGIGNGSKAGNVLYCAGWACAMSGFISSIVTTSNLTKAQKILEAGRGNVNIGVNDRGISLSYSWH